jgi:peptidoglycan hydrolase FlgJ
MNTISGVTPLDTSIASSRLSRDPSLAAQRLGHANPLSQKQLESSPSGSSQFDSVSGGSEELQTAFQDFVGQTLFGSMLASMRKTQDKPAYMHGGRAEEVFQQQLDQHIVDDMTKASADTIAGPMYNLFNLQRRAS